MSGEPQPNMDKPAEVEHSPGVMPELVEPAFPTTETKRERCMTHLRLHGQAMLNDALLQGIDFDVVANGHQTTLIFECPGWSLLTRHCGLSLVHYDEDGSELNRGRLEF